MVRLGIVGPGIIWRTGHKDALAGLPEFKVAAFCARQEQHRNEAARDFPDARLFGDYHDLARCDGIDALVVLTPIPLNAPVAIAGLKAGKDVYVEKPLAASLADAQRVLTAARAARRRVTVLEQAVYAPIWAKVKDLIAAGDIGRPVMFDRLIHNFITPETDEKGYASTDWRLRPQYPLGQMFDGGIHHVAVHAELFGAPESVLATGQKLREGYGEYDNLQMLFRFASGVSGMFSHSGFLGGQRGYFHVRGTEGLIVIQRDQLSVEPKRGTPRAIPCPAEGTLHQLIWRRLAQCARTGEPPPYTAEMGLRDVATIAAIAASAKSGKPEKC